MAEFQIRNMERVSEGNKEWVEADVVNAAGRLHVTRKFGSWMHDTGNGFREVVPDLALKLQNKAREQWPAIEKRLQVVR